MVLFVAEYIFPLDSSSILWVSRCRFRLNFHTND